jgi:sugar lactone lactonase YvrE
MKRIIQPIAFIAVFLIFAAQMGAQTITTGTISANLCAGGAASVPFTITGTFTAGNVFTAQLSNASGSFSSPVSIGTLTGVAAGTINATIPANATGAAYKIRVVSSTPAITGAANSSNINIQGPPQVSITGLACEGSVLTANSTPAATTLQWNLNGAMVQTYHTTWATDGITVAGGNGFGTANNQLYSASGVAVDAAGNVYVADQFNARVQKWAPGATTGVLVAGGNGQGSAANQLDHPTYIQLDASGNIYIADQKNNRIQKWAPGATTGTTVAGGTQGTGATQLNQPQGIYLDAAGNLYIADTGNHRIQKWAAGASTGTTVAGGNGVGSGANQFTIPTGVFVTPDNTVYVADQNNNRIQKWPVGATTGTTVTGGSQGSGANQFYHPSSVFIDAAGDLFVSDQLNNRIQERVAGASTNVTVAGGNGQGGNANQLKASFGLCLDAAGNLFVADVGNFRIQKYAFGLQKTYTPASSGNYTVTATTAAGCVGTSTALAVNSAPTVSVSSVAQTVTNPPNGSATASATGGMNPYTYLWSNGSTSTSIHNLTAGMYCLTVTDSKGCTRSACATVQLMTAVDDLEFPVSISVFPNAASTIFNLSIDTPVSSEVSVTIADINGRLIETKSPMAPSDHVMVQFDASSWASGVYVLQIKIGEHLRTRKIIIER